MIPTDCNRRFQIPSLDEIVDRLPHLSPFAVTKPANARRQSLEMHAIARQTQPTIQRAIVRKHLECQIVRFANVFRISRKRHPSKRSFAFAEKRSNVFGNKARYLERIGASRIKRLLANVVAVVKRYCSRTL